MPVQFLKDMREDEVPPPRARGWADACPPDSPLGQAMTESHQPLRTLYKPRKEKTFIHNHLRTMDICNHPGLVPLHGQYLSSTWPHVHYKLHPAFTISSTSVF